MAADAIRTTIRVGSQVDHATHTNLPAALLALREQLGALGATRGTATVFRREIAPAAQVAARGEVRVPGRGHAGIDVRGDGSTEAWTGRWRRVLVVQQSGEDAYAALSRVLGDA